MKSFLSSPVARFTALAQLSYFALISAACIWFTMPVWFVGTTLLSNALFLNLCPVYIEKNAGYSVDAMYC